MENSFFVFRNETADKTVPSSDDEIDDSGAGNASSSLLWKKVPKNQTAYVPESDSGSNSMVTDDSQSSEDGKDYQQVILQTEKSGNVVANSSDDVSDVESSDEEQPLKTVKSKPARRQYAVSSSEDADDSDEEQEEDTQPLATKSVVTRSSVISSVELSSDDDTNRHGSVRKQSASSSKNKLESSHRSSSGEEEVSPELIPKRRPQIRDQRKSKDSPMIRRIKKRMLLTDSENDNSIIIEKEKSTKQACLKATPLKIEVNKTTGEFVPRDMSNMTGDDSMVYDDEASNNEISEEDVAKTPSGSVEEGDDDGPDEDEMVMSRATRMSIMGVVPKDRDSDESDYLQTDESSLQSRDPSVGSTNSLNDLPEIGVGNKTSIACQQPKPDSPIDIPKEQNSTGINDSNISCSSIESLDVSVEMIDPRILSEKKTNLDNVFAAKNVNKSVGNKDVMKAVGVKVEKKEVDADVMIIDHQSEIIALSSDEDDYQPVAAPAKKPARASRSPANKKSPKIETSSTETPPAGGSMKQYLLPPSYPNQGVVYVKRSVRENEMNKLGQLQEDLHNVRHILEHMEVETLPDKGAKLLERFNKLERDVKTQAERVANMRVEPDNPSAQDIANDGFQSKVLSWEELQKASNEVQPRMFGKQAMSTHLAERNLILERLRSLHESLGSRPGEDALHAPPAAVRAELMPHQLHALAWLRWRETQRPPAGILADDMGLGKTITMISLILSSKESKIDDEDDDDDSDDEWRGKENRKLSRGGTLVVCPASLLQQWAGEVEKHCRAHALSVLLHHGNNRSTQANRVATHDLVITTYNLLQRDCEKNGVLFRINWQRVILDEAHIVRNHKSATCGAVSAIRGRRRWCLTGTPVQNKDLDVFALLKFMKCTPFDDLTMWKKWIDNKSLGGQERLSTIMRCLMLRRTKAQLQQRGQLACLPQRQAHQRQVTLTKDEMNVYQKVLVFSKTLFAQFLHQRAEKQADGGFLPKAPGKDDAYAKMHKKMVALQGAKPVKSHEILVLLLRLRQVCCHCGLIAAMLDGSDTAVDEEDQGSVDLLSELKKLTIEDEKTDKNDTLGDDEPTEDVSVADAIRSVLSPNNPVFKLTQPSSKIRGVMECLNTNVFANKGDKAVVVSQWTSVLRLVQQELTAIGVKSVTLSGQVPVPARQGLVQQLNDPNSSTKVMLLSLCAGGVGLNLCGANHLLLLDPHWNPQLEEQAQDRIYRVGQKKDVHIYRFMCVDTVEQSIRQLQQVKLELAESVLTGARPTSAAKLTIDDLKMLFNMGQE